MIRNPHILTKFEDEQMRKEKLTYKEALTIFEAMWNEAVSLGVLPTKDPLKGIEHKIRLARILNSCSKKL